MKSWMPSRQPVKRRSLSAFTLLELLVVVGVLAVLISILIPVVSKSRQQASFVQCSSNLRQICQWGFMYAADYKGFLPTSYIDSGGSYDITAATSGWADISYGNSYPTQKGFWTMKAGPPYELYKLRTATEVDRNCALFCPQAGTQFDPARNMLLGTTYALNQYLGGQRNFTAHGSAPIPRLPLLHARVYWFTEASIRNIGGVYDYSFGVMPLGTSAFDAGIGPWCWDWTGTTATVKAYGHPSGLANFAYGDGHVEPMTRQTFDALMKDSTGSQAFLGRYY